MEEGEINLLQTSIYTNTFFWATRVSLSKTAFAIQETLIHIFNEAQFRSTKKKTINLPISQAVSRSESQTVRSQSVRHAVSQWDGRSVGRSAGRSIGRSVSQ